MNNNDNNAMNTYLKSPCALLFIINYFLYLLMNDMIQLKFQILFR
jgi:hypothetical protein